MTAGAARSTRPRAGTSASQAGPGALAGSFEHPAAAGDWGRRALRLVRRNGGAPLDDAQALLSEPGQALRLRWLDGTEVGFTVALLSALGPRVRVAVRRGG